MISNQLLRHQEASINSIRMHPEIPFVFLIGGFGCLTGDSILTTPEGPVSMYKFQGGPVLTPLGFRNASLPIPARSEVVSVEAGDFQIHCNGAHLLKSSDGNWIRVSRLLARLLVKSICSNPLETIQDNSLKAQHEGVQHWMQTVLDYLYCYLFCFHFDDAQLRLLEEGVQDVTPLLEYAHDNNPECYEDGRILPLCIRLLSLLYPLSKRHSMSLKDHLVSVFEVLTSESYQKLREDFCATLELSQCLKDPDQLTVEVQGSIFQISAYNTSLFDIRIISDKETQIPLKNITFYGIDTTYRMHVEEAECFYANGLLHHNCGKSFTDVQLCLFLYHAYKNSKEPITIGILGVTIKLLKQTVIADLERAFDAGNITYRDNSQAGTITVGQVTFVYLAMQNPDDIYAFNFHCAICDEIDEVPSERVKKIVTAIQERCRVVMPAGKDMPSRDPFIFFSTTAQGLGGTYQLIEYFKKKQIPYIKIRGRTQDNTNLAKSQLELLRGLYTEDEARAYLDGEFVNLSTGLVYPEFDATKHKYMRFKVREGKAIPVLDAYGHEIPTKDAQGNIIGRKETYQGGDVIYVGQDFNAGYNAAVEIIERGGKMFIINSHHWNYVGDGARQLRELYPNNKIVLIPDANGKEIMSGFVEEFEAYNIEIHWNNINPSILERITGINKALRFGLLYVFEDQDKLLMGLETRDFDDNGKPRKGKGPEALDHHCDATEYAFWHIIHTIHGYDKILEAIKAVHHIKQQVRDAEVKEAA